ncbi:MAG: ATP-binding protein, partial [Anaerolineae bacterium]|nr:ATP-binding protein [Anaerolineae bacterium]
MAGEKVLIIDSKKDAVQSITESVLRPHGYSYMVAHTGEEGFRLALEKEPDLIIIDLRTPKMSGLEILKALQAKGRHIPVILMALYGSEETAVQAFRLGAKDYIIRPFKVEDMLEAIDRALSEKRLRDQKDQSSKGMIDVDQQLKRRVKELNILYSVGKSVTSLLDLEKVLNRIVEAAVFVTGAEEGSLLLVDKDTGELYLRASLGLGEKFARGFRLKVEQSIAGQVVKTGQPILQSTQEEETLKVKTGYLVKSLVNVPLKAKDEVIGVLAVNNKMFSRPFTENDVHLLSALADYATIAIVNAQLYEETKRWSEELERKVEERTRELRAAQEQLLQSEKLASIGKLAAGVAHEINNPMGVILGFAQGILKTLPEDNSLRKPLTIVEKESLRCKRIVQNLLDFARHSEPTPHLTNINELIDTCCELVEHQISLQNVQLFKDYDPALPAIMADPHQLQQVFINIMLNAYQAMPGGGSLRITTRTVDSELQVIFADTGTGIPSENLQNIFDPFFTTKEVGEGTGLGLSVSYGIVKAHGGDIEVESQVGEGTTFVIKLPLDKSEDNE